MAYQKPHTSTMSSSWQYSEGGYDQGDNQHTYEAYSDPHGTGAYSYYGDSEHTAAVENYNTVHGINNESSSCNKQDYFSPYVEQEHAATGTGEDYSNYYSTDSYHSEASAIGRYEYDKNYTENDQNYAGNTTTDSQKNQYAAESYEYNQDYEYSGEGYYAGSYGQDSSLPTYSSNSSYAESNSNSFSTVQNYNRGRGNMSTQSRGRGNMQYYNSVRGGNVQNNYRGHWKALSNNCGRGGGTGQYEDSQYQSYEYSYNEAHKRAEFYGESSDMTSAPQAGLSRAEAILAQNYCDLCSIQLTSSMAYNQHINGILHKKKVEARDKTLQEEVISKYKPDESNKHTRDANPIEEHESDDDVDIDESECRLCNIKFKNKQMYAIHIRGTSHYLKVQTWKKAKKEAAAHQQCNTAPQQADAAVEKTNEKSLGHVPSDSCAESVEKDDMSSDEATCATETITSTTDTCATDSSVVETSTADTSVVHQHSAQNCNVTGPSTTESSATESSATEPSATEPGETEPSTSECKTVEPSTTAPDTLESRTRESTPATQPETSVIAAATSSTEQPKSGSPTSVTSEPLKLNTFCNICFVLCSDPQAYESHMKSDYHKTEVRKKDAIKQGEPISPDGENLSWRKKIHQWGIDGLGKELDIDDDSSIRCKVCNIFCTGYKSYAMHIDGAKHKKKLKNNLLVDEISKVDKLQLEATKEVRLLKPSEVKGVFVQKLLDECKDALIGVDYMTEFAAYDVESKYRCLLCDKKMDPRQVIQHLTCLRHRRRYVKFHHPSIYREHNIEAKFSSSDASILAKKLEEKEGRYDIRLRIEVPKEMKDEQDVIDMMNGTYWQEVKLESSRVRPYQELVCMLSSDDVPIFDKKSYRERLRQSENKEDQERKWKSATERILNHNVNENAQMARFAQPLNLMNEPVHRPPEMHRQPYGHDSYSDPHHYPPSAPHPYPPLQQRNYPPHDYPYARNPYPDHPHAPPQESRIPSSIYTRLSPSKESLPNESAPPVGKISQMDLLKKLMAVLPDTQKPFEPETTATQAEQESPKQLPSHYSDMRYSDAEGEESIGSKLRDIMAGQFQDKTGSRKPTYHSPDFEDETGDRALHSQQRSQSPGIQRSPVYPTVSHNMKRSQSPPVERGSATCAPKVPAIARGMLNKDAMGLKMTITQDVGSKINYAASSKVKLGTSSAAAAAQELVKNLSMCAVESDRDAEIALRLTSTLSKALLDYQQKSTNKSDSTRSCTVTSATSASALNSEAHSAPPRGGSMESLHYDISKRRPSLDRLEQHASKRQMRNLSPDAAMSYKVQFPSPERTPQVRSSSSTKETPRHSSYIDSSYARTSRLSSKRPRSPSPTFEIPQRKKKNEIAGFWKL